MNLEDQIISESQNAMSVDEMELMSPMMAKVETIELQSENIFDKDDKNSIMIINEII